MKRQKISGIFADAQSFDGQMMTVCGWARTIRDMKNFGFIELNDGSCFKSLQVVMARDRLANYDEIDSETIDRMLHIFCRLNHIHEEDAKKAQAQEETA